LHPVQEPLALQTILSPQVVPAAALVFEGTPLAHEPTTQGLLALGTLVSELTLVVFPAPSHTFFLHVPSGWLAVAVPSGMLMVTHVWETHLNCLHSVEVPQEESVVHSVVDGLPPESCPASVSVPPPLELEPQAPSAMVKTVIATNVDLFMMPFVQDGRFHAQRGET
jgi:hypothetical protein